MYTLNVHLHKSSVSGSLGVIADLSGNSFVATMKPDGEVGRVLLDIGFLDAPKPPATGKNINIYLDRNFR